MGGVTSLTVAQAGGACAWVVPTYKNARPLWRMVERACRPLLVARQCRIDRTSLLVEFKTGGYLGVYTADNPDSILGEGFDLVVMDEAARYKEEVWTETIMPTLADRDGRALMISTPRGHNWFWREWERGFNGEEGYASWQLPTSANPNPSIQRAAGLARERVSSRVYEQEWLAQFNDSSGSVFRFVRKAATSTVTEPEPGHIYCIGADWARDVDFTAFSVIDVTEGRQVFQHRSNEVDYAIQAARLTGLSERYNNARVVAESNAMGLPIIESLQRANVPVDPWKATNATKAAAVELLALAFERGAIRILDDPVLIGEIQAFTYSRTATGLVRYEAASGGHDDTVIALMLAWLGAASTVTGEVLA